MLFILAFIFSTLDPFDMYGFFFFFFFILPQPSLDKGIGPWEVLILIGHFPSLC